MDEITVKDYGIFNEAIGNIKEMTNSIYNDIDSISNTINSLDETVFSGPVKNSFLDGYKSIGGEIRGSINIFNGAEIGLLEHFYESYQSADQTVSNKVGSV